MRGGNTAAVLTRTILTAAAGIVAVRIALQALGVTDYGAYAAVSGLVALVTSFSTVLLPVANRFLAWELGRAGGDIRSGFSGTFLFAAVMAALVVLVAETLGRWYLESRLAIPAEARQAAAIAFRLVVGVTVLGIFQVPYLAVLVARERLGFFAAMGLAEASLSLVAVLSATLVETHRVEMLSLAMLVKAAVVLAVLAAFVRHSFPEARIGRTRGSVFTFAGFRYYWWTLVGNLSNAVKYRGTGLVLNRFCGVSANAAWGSATGMYFIFASLVASFQLVYSPALVKLRARGEDEMQRKVMIRSVVESVAIALVFALPVFVFAPWLVPLWLGDSVPPGELVFVRLFMVHLVLDAVSAPLTSVITATERIARYHSGTLGLTLVVFIGMRGLIAAGFPAWTSVAALVVLNAALLVYRIVFIRYVVRL